jgi:hypothetical protein
MFKHDTLLAVIINKSKVTKDGICLHALGMALPTRLAQVCNIRTIDQVNIHAPSHTVGQVGLSKLLVYQIHVHVCVMCM